MPCYHASNNDLPNLAWNHPTLLSETVEVFIFASLSSRGGWLAGGGELGTVAAAYLEPDSSSDSDILHTSRCSRLMESRGTSPQSSGYILFVSRLYIRHVSNLLSKWRIQNL